MRGPFWALLSGAAVLLASVAARAQCTKDLDCKGDRVCDAGKCTSPAPPSSSSAGAAAPGTATPEGAPPAATTPVSATEPTPGSALNGSVTLPPPSTDGAPAGATSPLGSDEPEVRRRNRGAMVAGIAMVSVGPIALLGALVAKNSQNSCDDALNRDYPDHKLPTSEKYRVDDCNSYSVPVYLFGIGGAVLMAAGVPLIIYGAKNVPLHPAASSLRVLPWAGPDSAGLKLRLEL